MSLLPDALSITSAVPKPNRHAERLAYLRRPQFSCTRIKGESDVKGGGGLGWVEASEGSCVGAAAGSRALAPGQRWSASRKRDVVLRLLRGESLDAVSREVGLEVYRLEAWKARAMVGIELGLKAQAGEPLAAELDAAKRHIGELSMENELLPKPKRLHRICGQTRTPNRVGAPGHDATPGFLGTRGRHPHARRRRSVVHPAGSTSPAVGLLRKFLPAIKQWRNPTRLPRRWVCQKIAGCNGG